jgi:hypothetical protein
MTDGFCNADRVRAPSTLQARACFATAVLVWGGAWYVFAVHQYRQQRVCDLFAGPFLPCGPHEWQAPLVIGVGPALLVVAVGLARAVTPFVGKARAILVARR